VSAKTGVGADVFQVVGLLGACVKERLELDASARVHFGLPRFNLLRPLGSGFHDECFAVGIEFVGHGRFSVNGVYWIVASILARAAAKSLEPPAVARYWMKPSGTKLVIGLACLALAAGLASWSYRYGATHESTRFWGSEAALLIARPSEVELFRLELADSAEPPSQNLDLGRLYAATPLREISKERGMVHFRHALMTDGNYEWANEPEPSEIDWRWGMRFHDGQIQALVVLAEDFATIGLLDQGRMKALSCQPMAETLRHYFGKVDLTSASTSQ